MKKFIEGYHSSYRVCFTFPLIKAQISQKRKWTKLKKTIHKFSVPKRHHAVLDGAGACQYIFAEPCQGLSHWFPPRKPCSWSACWHTTVWAHHLAQCRYTAWPSSWRRGPSCQPSSNADDPTRRSTPANKIDQTIHILHLSTFTIIYYHLLWSNNLKVFYGNMLLTKYFESFWIWTDKVIP